MVSEWPFLAVKEYALQHFKLAMEPLSGSITNLNVVIETKILELMNFLNTRVKNEGWSCHITALLKMLPAYFKEKMKHSRFLK